MNQRLNICVGTRQGPSWIMLMKVDDNASLNHMHGIRPSSSSSFQDSRFVDPSLVKRAHRCPVDPIEHVFDTTHDPRGFFESARE